METETEEKVWLRRRNFFVKTLKIQICFSFFPFIDFSFYLFSYFSLSLILSSLIYPNIPVTKAVHEKLSIKIKDVKI